MKNISTICCGKIVQLYTGLLPLKAGLYVEFFRKFKYVPDLDNPQTFNEKLAWRKLHQAPNNTDFANWSDKIWSKEEVCKRFGEQYCLDNVWVGDDPRDIPFETLTPPYVIKTSNGSHDQVFIREEKDIDKEAIIRFYQQQFKKKFGLKTHEYHYLHIRPRLLIEPMMIEDNGECPLDYKFHVFNGKLEVVQIDVGRFNDHRRALYRPDWEKIDGSLFVKRYEDDLPKPESYDDMMRLATQIGQLFDYVRVDFYNYQGRAVFGEATFTHGCGYESFEPASLNEYYGSKWGLDECKQAA